MPSFYIDCEAMTWKSPILSPSTEMFRAVPLFLSHSMATPRSHTQRKAPHPLATRGSQQRQRQGYATQGAESSLPGDSFQALQASGFHPHVEPSGLIGLTATNEKSSRDIRADNLSTPHLGISLQGLRHCRRAPGPFLGGGAGTGKQACCSSGFANHLFFVGL